MMFCQLSLLFHVYTNRNKAILTQASNLITAIWMDLIGSHSNLRWCNILAWHPHRLIYPKLFKVDFEIKCFSIIRMRFGKILGLSLLTQIKCSSENVRYTLHFKSILKRTSTASTISAGSSSSFTCTYNKSFVIFSLSNYTIDWLLLQRNINPHLWRSNSILEIAKICRNLNKDQFKKYFKIFG